MIAKVYFSFRPYGSQLQKYFLQSGAITVRHAAVLRFFSDAMSQYTFLVTGASSGLGLHISLQALKAGHSVVGTARNPEKAAQDHPEFEQLGGVWQNLDVTDPNTQSIVEKVVQDKAVNVLVNNAGYGILGSLEDIR